MTTDEILAWLDRKRDAMDAAQMQADERGNSSQADRCSGQAFAYSKAATHIRATLAAESQRDTAGQTSVGDGE